jgi:hypothetical protein
VQPLMAVTLLATLLSPLFLWAFIYRQVQVLLAVWLELCLAPTNKPLFSAQRPFTRVVVLQMELGTHWRGGSVELCASHVHGAKFRHCAQRCMCFRLPTFDDVVASLHCRLSCWPTVYGTLISKIRPSEPGLD